ncbi:hypothetical protein PO124_29430 [Bacillus licheniformis]|nr:hypothetical protein [Bacillus licheniformis]
MRLPLYRKPFITQHLEIPLFTAICFMYDKQIKRNGEFIMKQNGRTSTRSAGPLLSEPFRTHGNSHEHPFLAIYLTQVKGASSGFAGAVIAASSLIGIAASFMAGTYQTGSAGNHHARLDFGWTFVFAGLHSPIMSGHSLS